MRKTWKKWTSILLAFCMAMSLMSVAVFAEDGFEIHGAKKVEGWETETVTISVKVNGEGLNAGNRAYIAVKQSTGMMVWTQSELTAEQQAELAAVIKAADESHYEIVKFISGEGTFTMGDESKYQGQYTFAVYEDEATLTCEKGRISHAVYGTYTVPEEETKTPPTISFKSGEASNISFMLIDKATGEVDFLYKIDIEDQTSFEIPVEEGKISAVFVKQSTSGMFWFSEKPECADATIQCLKENNPSYKGHNAVAYGKGEVTWAFKNDKYVTYTFSSDGDNSGKAEIMEDTAPTESVKKETSSKNNKNNKNNNKKNK